MEVSVDCGNEVALLVSPVEGEDVHLTQREEQVLFLAIEGKSSKEIGGVLFVSPRTVEYHIANAYDKLQVSNRVQAFRRAVELGLVSLEKSPAALAAA